LIKNLNLVGIMSAFTYNSTLNETAGSKHALLL